MARAVGRNVLRKDGVDKVTGAAKYIDDLSFPNLLHARTIRSTIPAGEITGVAFNFDQTGFTIVDHRDVPGRNIVALIDDDQPCLAERTIRHAAEPILIEATASAKGPLLMQSAISALQACQPYGMLPVDRYGEWKVLDLSFTPQDFSSS